MGHGLVVMISHKEPLFMASRVITGFMPKKCLLIKTVHGHGHGLTAVSMTSPVGVDGLTL